MAKSCHLLPNLIIAGVNKAGTTSLFSYLALHPDICVSSVKETGYFSPLKYSRELQPLNHYSQHFRHCGNQKYIMEATPGYFYGGVVLAREIKKQLGDVKIILVFRNPVDRLISFYRFQKSRIALNQSLSLAEYIHLCENPPPDERRKQENNAYWGIEGGFYANYLPAWFEVFGDSVNVVFFEHLRENRLQFLGDLCEWLKIDHTVFETGKLQLELENKSINYKNELLQRIALFINDQGEKFWRAHPRFKHLVRRIYRSVNAKQFGDIFPKRTLAYLESLFRPYNQRLAAELLKRGYKNLPIWLAEEERTVSTVDVNGENISIEQNR